jgi:hypothetical protein
LQLYCYDLKKNLSEAESEVKGISINEADWPNDDTEKEYNLITTLASEEMLRKCEQKNP